MGLHFTQDDIVEIVRLHEVEGLTHKDIAVKMGRLDKKGNPNARAIMEQYSKYKRMKSLEKPSQPITQLVPTETIPMIVDNGPPLLPMNVAVNPKDESPQIARFAQDSEVVQLPKQKTAYVFNPDELKIKEDNVNLSELTRNQRYDYLRKNLLKSTRGMHLFNKVLSKEEADLFCEEYFRILKEQDSLTNAEEQSLFAAILNYVLYHRALEMDKAARTKYESGAAGSVYDTRWQKEYNDRFTQYQKGIETLKLSRQQRLQDLARSGNTFLDLAEQLYKIENQEALTDEVMQIEKMTEKETQRLQENGWILFGGSPNNNPEVNYFDNKQDE